MRQQFVTTISDVMKKDEQVIVLLGDIGVHGFRNVFTEHPKRIYNIGILEQTTIGTAAGLAVRGLIPVVHTIAPFLIERAYEQLKDDFGYQELNGNFVSVGASYDYAGLGCTHHCPGDIGILKNIPNMDIVIPGTAQEFDTLFKTAYKKNNPTYYRLSEVSNTTDQKVVFGKGLVIKRGKKATIIAIGPMLQKVVDATTDMDVTILYYTTIAPFDNNLIRKVMESQPNQHVIICEPYYEGMLTFDVSSALKSKHVKIDHIGVPHRFLNNYGTVSETDKDLGLDTAGVRKKIQTFLKNNK